MIYILIHTYWFLYNVVFDQRRGFKTKRAASATELTTRKSKEEDVGLTGLFRVSNSLHPICIWIIKAHLGVCGFCNMS